jgi:glycyl-tRNA synthetase beta chain
MLSLIDKIDTLTCFFKIGKKPTGSKDPFALRRSASGIVKLLTEFNINISLNNLFLCSLNLHNNVTKSLQIELIDFIIDRLKISLKNKDIKNDIINSILLSDNINNLSFQIILQRINILSKKNEDERFKNFLHNFKRLNNILKPNDLLKITSAKVNPNLLENNNEKDIFLMINNFKSRNTNSEVNVDIQEKVLNEIIDFGDPISNFFGTVTVNVKDVEIKKNRLCLLYIIREEIIKYSNFHLMDD